MKCPGCGDAMVNLGNISGLVYDTYPAQWIDTYVCHKCKRKVNKAERGTLPPDYSFLDDYKGDE